MSRRGRLVAESALRLIGTPFRLHGRDPGTGLDCVGLVAICLGEAGCSVHLPTGYRLRNNNAKAWLQRVDLGVLEPVAEPQQPGDVALIAPSPAQLHLVVITEIERGQPTEITHAHAQLRRVVRQTLAAPLAPIASWHVP